MTPVLQVSRCDALKDLHGVIAGLAPAHRAANRCSCALLGGRTDAADMKRAAQERVRGHCLGPHSLPAYLDLLGRLL